MLGCYPLGIRPLGVAVVSANYSIACTVGTYTTPAPARKISHLGGSALGALPLGGGASGSTGVTFALTFPLSVRTYTVTTNTIPGAGYSIDFNLGSIGDGLSGATFSRGRWHAMLEEMAAEEEARKAARRRKREARREALAADKAEAEASKRAAWNARLAADRGALDQVQMQRLLQGAQGTQIIRALIAPGTGTKQ